MSREKRNADFWHTNQSYLDYWNTVISAPKNQYGQRILTFKAPPGVKAGTIRMKMYKIRSSAEDAFRGTDLYFEQNIPEMLKFGITIKDDLVIVSENNFIPGLKAYDCNGNEVVIGEMIDPPINIITGEPATRGTFGIYGKEEAESADAASDGEMNDDERRQLEEELI